MNCAILTTMRAASFAQVLLQGRWYADLEPAFQTALLAEAHVKRFKAGTQLFARGDDPDGLYAVVDGAVRVTSVTASGKEILLTRIEAPTWFGEIAVFDCAPRTHDCVADTDAVVVHLAQARIIAILDDDPKRWRDLGLLVAGKLRMTFDVLADVAVLPMPARLARRLVVLAEEHGAFVEHKKRTLSVTQEQLASMLSTSRQTVNQVLKDLELRGVIKLSYGAIEIVDHDALVALCPRG